MAEKRDGLTLIEILISIAVFGLVFAFAARTGINFYASHAILNERDTLVSLLRTARGKAMNNEEQLRHGLFVDTNQYTLFSGSSYATRDAEYDAAFPRSSGVAISGITEVVFAQLDGISSVSGTIALANGAGSAEIHINSEGKIQW